jgi:hypothetical protein
VTNDLRDPREPGQTPGADDGAPGWEMIAPGRYQPRRTRGSFPGRVLG